MQGGEEEEIRDVKEGGEREEKERETFLLSA